MTKKQVTKTTTKKTTTAKATTKKAAETVAAKPVDVVEEVKKEEPKASETAKTIKSDKEEVKTTKTARKTKAASAKTTTKKATTAKTPKVEEEKPAKTVKTEAVKETEAVKVEKPKTAKTTKATKTTRKATTTKAAKTTKTTKTAKAEEQKVAEPVKEEEKAATTTKTTAKKATKTAKKTTKAVKTEEPKAETVVEVKTEEPKAETVVEVKAEEPKAEPVEEIKVEEPKAEAVTEEKVEEPVKEEPKFEVCTTPRKSVAFIGSECYPFVKTGGLGDVMYALPKALAKQNCDVKVILPRYKCIPWEYQQKMIYKGSFQMNLCADGRTYYVGIMEYVWDGVVYDFIDNDEFFGVGNPYTDLINDIPRYCYFAKAALAALNFMNWVPDIIHCHDWQAALVPVYLRTLFENTKLTTAKTILTIHNLRFQGIYNIPTIKYWSGLPDYVFNKDALKVGYRDANMLKGGLTYANMITTVSHTYAGEIQTPAYGEKLDAHMRHHSPKLRGIVNGIDYDIWNTATDDRLYENYDLSNVLEKKRENKRRLQQELGLAQDDSKFVIGVISRLTNQKGLDLINAIMPQILDGNTQVVILGTGDDMYEDSFRYYENTNKGTVCSNIMYDETRAHRIYAGADALLVPSLFEPCGLTQLIAMHYGTIPIVRETGGLKDTVEPYNQYWNCGNGFTFDRYDAGLLLDAINRAKTLFFTNRWRWDEMVQRDMNKNLSWDNAAKQYKDLYLELSR
ncbi:MAG: glycogen/starch synthase [Lachnospiraceae bacterium]|nr:glycogen/starch synthase [Lachnospiraceae bacterium]